MQRQLYYVPTRTVNVLPRAADNPIVYNKTQNSIAAAGLVHK